ncbi:glycosyltransferase family 2 protein [Flavobacterium sp.]|uniref:glycosyltransferase family 2 protein n=1 Tax=Flavobacterium sp. TaxID=239 RepID=UPI0037506940
MLSILIPTYNYNALPLVTELHKQCENEGIEYEIISQDDASKSELNLENEKINSIKNCFFYVNEENLGRGKNRNSLADKSKFKWLLFLDSDTIPTKNDFIKNYIIVNPKHNVVFGGLKYQIEKPEKQQILRWVYGKKREALTLKERLKNPNKTALTSNFLIDRTIFLSHKFDNEITKYGYEDYLFFLNLEKKDISVHHIENPVIHFGLESSDEFLDKTKVALENLNNLYSIGLLSFNNNRILSIYTKLKKIKLVTFFSFIYSNFNFLFRKNLTSSNPSLFIFDVYKLSYFCKINLK